MWFGSGHPGKRALWTVLLFMLGFAVLIAVVSWYFLLPGMAALRDASAREQRQLSAVAALLLAVVLVILSIGLILLFRVHRFFFPRPPIPRHRTPHVDAWAEAGRRAQPTDET